MLIAQAIKKVTPYPSLVLGYPKSNASPRNPRRLNQEYLVLLWNQSDLRSTPIISAVTTKTINAHTKQISIFNSIDNKMTTSTILKALEGYLVKFLLIT